MVDLLDSGGTYMIFPRTASDSWLVNSVFALEIVFLLLLCFWNFHDLSLDSLIKYGGKWEREVKKPIL